MSLQNDINCFLVQAKCCAADLACEYVTEATYGSPKAQGLLDRLLLVKSLIKSVEAYVIIPGESSVLDGVLQFGCRRVLLSKNNSLSLESTGASIPVSPDLFNCLSEEELCQIVSKIRTLCPGC